MTPHRKTQLAHRIGVYQPLPAPPEGRGYIRAALGAACLFGLLWAGLWLTPDCATEDSTNCYWDAETSGNGLGRSFLDIGGNAFYISED